MFVGPWKRIIGKASIGGEGPTIFDISPTTSMGRLCCCVQTHAK